MQGYAATIESSGRIIMHIDTQDKLYTQAVKIVVGSQIASLSRLQRDLKIGYNRSARLLEAMESEGIVTPFDKYGHRDVLKPNVKLTGSRFCESELNAGLGLLIDCRACKNYYSGNNYEYCGSMIECIAGSAYRVTRAVQLWRCPDARIAIDDA